MALITFLSGKDTGTIISLWSIRDIWTPNGRHSRHRSRNDRQQWSCIWNQPAEARSGLGNMICKVELPIL